MCGETTFPQIGQPKRQCFCMAASPEGHRCVFQVPLVAILQRQVSAPVLGSSPQVSQRCPVFSPAPAAMSSRSQITSIDANLQAWSRVQHVHEEQQCDSSKFARALEANQSINTGGLLAARRASDAFNITYPQDFSVAHWLRST